jgi:hypothetical protein
MRGGSSLTGGSTKSERRRRNSTSPLKDRTKTTSTNLSSSSKRSSSPSATTLLDDDPTAVLFDEFTSPNPRSFPHSVKQKCWEKADKVKGRDPDRWRRDPLGNLIFRKLVGCPGCLCHDVPYSKVFISIFCNFFFNSIYIVTSNCFSLLHLYIVVIILILMVK